VAELVHRWAAPLERKSWAERLTLLNEIHDHLMEELETFEELCEIFPRLVAGLIEHLGADDVTSLEQAHIYANSIDVEHRKVAGAWLAAHQGPGGISPRG